jgi:predicted RNA binding protein YcfA (HicA-like mRNA interferase family)
MPKLPRISGAEAIKIFEDLGFSIARQKGSHVVLRKGDVGCVIPLHKELAVGTLRSAIKQAKLSAEDFLEAYNQR